MHIKLPDDISRDVAPGAAQSLCQFLELSTLPTASPGEAEERILMALAFCLTRNGKPQ